MADLAIMPVLDADCTTLAIRPQKARKRRATIYKLDELAVYGKLEKLAKVRGPGFEWDGGHYTKQKRSWAPNREQLTIGTPVLQVLCEAAPSGYPCHQSVRNILIRLQTAYNVFELLPASNTETIVFKIATDASDLWRIQAKHAAVLKSSIADVDQVADDRLKKCMEALTDVKYGQVVQRKRKQDSVDDGQAVPAEFPDFEAGSNESSSDDDGADATPHDDGAVAASTTKDDGAVAAAANGDGAPEHPRGDEGPRAIHDDDDDDDCIIVGSKCACPQCMGPKIDADACGGNSTEWDRIEAAALADTAATAAASRAFDVAFTAAAAAPATTGAVAEIATAATAATAATTVPPTVTTCKVSQAVNASEASQDGVKCGLCWGDCLGLDSCAKARADSQSAEPPLPIPPCPKGAQRKETLRVRLVNKTTSAGVKKAKEKLRKQLVRKLGKQKQVGTLVKGNTKRRSRTAKAAGEAEAGVKRKPASSAARKNKFDLDEVLVPPFYPKERKTVGYEQTYVVAGPAKRYLTGKSKKQTAHYQTMVGALVKALTAGTVTTRRTSEAFLGTMMEELHKDDGENAEEEDAGDDEEDDAEDIS
jgi:hypothetical protein